MFYLILFPCSPSFFLSADLCPAHAGCYYILGFILFVLNHLEEALVLLEMGKNVDPEFGPIGGMEREIQNILSGYRGTKDEAPLMEGETLSRQLKAVLLELFQSFDKDRDGALRPEELDAFIYATNGLHPPEPFLRQMGQKFGSNAQGWLTQDGFLVTL